MAYHSNPERLAMLQKTPNLYDSTRKMASFGDATKGIASEPRGPENLAIAVVRHLGPLPLRSSIMFSFWFFIPPMVG